MKIISIDCSKIKCWETFHELFSETLGFPDYYGRNLNALIDCLDDSEQSTALAKIACNEVFCLFLNEVKILKQHHLDMFIAILDCVMFVNWRAVQAGRAPKIMLAAHP
jgi:RNAse (barnase) inhibitor barstar